jgi:hypothetical protein
MRHMGWVRRWEERTDAKDRNRRQRELEQDQLRLQEDLLRRTIPVEPIMGPDKTPLTVSCASWGHKRVKVGLEGRSRYSSAST